MFRGTVSRAKRRVLIPAALAVTALVVAVVLVAGAGGGGAAGGVSYVGGSTSAVLYAAGHRHPVPDFTGTTLTGSRLSFAAYRGRVVVVNFWGSWCTPCRAEAPALAVLSAKYQPSGVRFLGVDVNDDPASAGAFARGFGIRYPSVSDPGYVITQDFSSAVPISGTPTTLVVDRSGRVAGAVFGSTTYSELNAILMRVTGKAA
ncbi:MAG: TlpA family protein disulfide reductase [Streptosporangiaceae bacterium]|nr:TlpA family protein disulfide reductase [Streptosporangiaceae bacterium]MBV9853456.1 TlpA family protein disulfide reductase [Streptosporangiaceae bacterium]